MHGFGGMPTSKVEFQSEELGLPEEETNKLMPSRQRFGSMERPPPLVPYRNSCKINRFYYYSISSMIVIEKVILFYLKKIPHLYFS